MSSTLLQLLNDYRPLDAEDARQADRIRRYVETDPHCFERTNLVGHITGSAWIVDPSGTRVLLTRHKKLGKWLQVGGHADGDPDVCRVARREAHEETGLQTLSLVSEKIFDLDVHRIPAYGADPEHDHYDVRFAFRSDDIQFKVTEESHALAWIEIERISLLTGEESLLRMARKWKAQAFVK